MKARLLANAAQNWQDCSIQSSMQRTIDLQAFDTSAQGGAQASMVWATSAQNGKQRQHPGGHGRAMLNDVDGCAQFNTMRMGFRVLDDVDDLCAQLCTMLPFFRLGGAQSPVISIVHSRAQHLHFGGLGLAVFGEADDFCAQLSTTRILEFQIARRPHSVAPMCTILEGVDKHELRGRRQ